jgi:putative exporter of polyketide antibiotics
MLDKKYLRVAYGVSGMCAAMVEGFFVSADIARVLCLAVLFLETVKDIAPAGEFLYLAACNLP